MRPNTTLLCTLEGLYYKHTPSLFLSSKGKSAGAPVLSALPQYIGTGGARTQQSCSPHSQHQQLNAVLKYIIFHITLKHRTKYPTAVLYVTLSVLCFTQEACSEAKIPLQLRVQACSSWILLWSTNTRFTFLNSYRENHHRGPRESFIYLFLLWRGNTTASILNALQLEDVSLRCQLCSSLHCGPKCKYSWENCNFLHIFIIAKSISLSLNPLSIPVSIFPVLLTGPKIFFWTVPIWKTGPTPHCSLSPGLLLLQRG